jgi:cytochrome c oxidase subunit 2
MEVFPIVTNARYKLPTTLLSLVLLANGVAFAQDTARTIEVHVKRFAFVPAEISVKKGEKVKLSLISDDVPHSLVIPDLHVKQEITKGHPSEVVITSDKAGDFHGQCGRFCGSGHGTMLFVVHVKDN